MEQNRIIHFFDYNKAFKHYTTIIDSMRQGYIKNSGIRKIAKPILILSLIYGIEKGLYNTNKFEYKELEHLYNEIFDKYAELAKQSEKTPLCYPFYYLQTDSFWHHSNYTHGEEKTLSPTSAWISNNVEYAYIDEELWLLLRNECYRNKLKNYIIENKILKVQTKHNLLLKQFIGWLLAV